ncbi:MAG: anti-sigma factor [Proteobacteria bacterium]|nr:anti-sigma factor [Pseudomonadota bacterium]
MSGTQPIREEDLHAYVDGQLEPARRPAVEDYLAATPAAAAKVAAYAAQRNALHAAFDARAAEPLPPELDLSRLLETRLARRRAPWRLAAASAAFLLIGAAAGWALRGATLVANEAPPMARFAQQALATHAVYAVDRRHPVEVQAAEREHLVRWLSNRLDRDASPPDLSSIGYHLIGGRLLATERGGPAALFMYENEAHVRLSVILRPMAPALHAPRTEIARGETHLCGWIDNGLGYAVVAAMPDAEIDRASDLIRKERDRAG